MAFNPFVWQLFCDSPTGQAALSTVFLRFSRMGRSPDGEGWRRQTNAKIPVYLETMGQPEVNWESGGHIDLREILSSWFAEVNDPLIYEDRFRALLADVGASQTWEEDQFPGKRCHTFFGGDDREDARYVASCVGTLSTTLHRLNPENFAPYYFRGASHCLMKYAKFSELRCQKYRGLFK